MNIKKDIIDSINLRIELLKEKNNQDRDEYLDAVKHHASDSTLEKMREKIVPVVEAYRDANSDLTMYCELIKEINEAYTILECNNGSEENTINYRTLLKKVLLFQEKLRKKYKVSGETEDKQNDFKNSFSLKKRIHACFSIMK